MSQRVLSTRARWSSVGPFLPEPVAARIEELLEEARARDETFDDHAENVARLSTSVGAALGLPRDELASLAVAARVHDIGKLTVPVAVLAKDGPLDDDEWSMIREHPGAGAEILTSCSAPPQVVDAVRSHHERWDGTGYPAGLAGRAIPIAARIIAAADAYSAMIEPRSYRLPMTIEAARAEMLAHAGSQFDADCAQAVLAVTAAD